MRRILAILILLLSFVSVNNAESLSCLCDAVPYQVSWQGYFATGDAELWPSDDPDDHWIVHHAYPDVFEWMMLEINVNKHQEAYFQIQVPNEEIGNYHCFLTTNSGRVVANTIITELDNDWYSVTALFLPGEMTDLYYLIWVK